jgi:hypothetical protein
MLSGTSQFKAATSDEGIGICRKITNTRVVLTGQEIVVMARELIEAMIELGISLRLASRRSTVRMIPYLGATLHCRTPRIFF